ncbi:hypothetical protein CG736_28120 [Kitasatospora sp. CB02891]|nr:hypothetical protein CG736_28120 [Kitasatospora sp. CB02891]
MRRVDQQDPPVCDGLGRPLVLTSTGGIHNDRAQAEAVIGLIRVARPGDGPARTAAPDPFVGFGVDTPTASRVSSIAGDVPA